MKVGAIFALAAALFLSPPAAATEPASSLGGSSGLLNVPTAEVLPEGMLRLGFRFIDREWAFVARGRSDSDVYFFALGFLPRTEVVLRATVFPQTHFPDETQSGSPQTDRLAGARVLLIEQGRLFPAVAVGVDDLHGNRLSHALYATATRGLGVGRQGRLDATFGYGFRILDAPAYVLDGAFAGLRGSCGDRASFLLEYDTEKWNGGVTLRLPLHLNLLAGLLDFDVVSGGASWSHQF